MRQKIGSQNTHYTHLPRGIASQQVGSVWNDAISDGLGSVRGWLNSSQAFTDTNYYDPYGVPDVSVVGYGFTGEMTDDNGLVYLRARYYDPNIGNFVSLNPFEGVDSRPMSMNGYSWVEGNIANWSDASGMFSCSGDNASACAEVNVALQRAQNQGLSFSSLATGNVDTNGLLNFKKFVRRAEQVFGLQFQAPGGVVQNPVSDLINLDDCTLEIIGQRRNALEATIENSILVQIDVLRAVAAMIHIVSKFAEWNFGSPNILFRDTLGSNSITFLAYRPIGEGFVRLDTTNTTIELGVGVTVSTIVHELGHAFDRAFNFTPSNILASGYFYSNSQNRFLQYTSPFPSDAVTLTPSYDRDGMKTRANDYQDRIEIWADVFMTWVMNGISSPTTAKIDSLPPNWDCADNNNSDIANVRYILTPLLMQKLLNRESIGEGEYGEFLNQVATLMPLANKPCNTV